MSYFKCVLCDQVFTDKDLQDVVELSKSRSGSGKMVRFKYGSIHDIRHLSPGMHSRWHSRYGITNYPGCFFCRLEQEKKLENEKQSYPPQEEAIPQEISHSESSYSTGGGAVVENLPPAETEPDSPESNPEPQPQANLGWAFRNTNWSR